MHEKINNIWKDISSRRLATAEEHLILCLVKAALVKSNNDKTEIMFNLVKKSFTPVTNQNKIDNGWHQWKAVSLICNCLSPTYLKRSVLTQNLNSMELDIVIELSYQLRTQFYDVGEYHDDPKSPLYDPTQVYILVRRDLTPIQQLVQVAHVASLVGEARVIRDPFTQHFVIFGVDNAQELKNNYEWLFSNSVNTFFFEESNSVSNAGDPFTAIATAPLRKSFAERKKLFTNLNLLTL